MKFLKSIHVYGITVVAILLWFATTAYSQNVEFAMTIDDYVRVGEFHDGFATYGVYGEDCKVIDRTGAVVGKVEGIIKYRDKENMVIAKRLFEYYLTDGNGKIVSKKFSNIIYHDGYFICKNKKDKWGVMDRRGKVRLKCKDSSYSTFGNSSAIYFRETGKVFYNGESVMVDKNVDEITLGNQSPIIKGKDFIYIKSTGKLVKLKGRDVVFGNNNKRFFALEKDGKREYFDFNNVKLELSDASKNSRGLHIEMGGGKYAIVNSSGYRVSHQTYDDIDPMFWSDGKLAVKSNGVWGYLNEDGTEFLKPQFKHADSFVSGFSIVDNIEGGIPKILRKEDPTLFHIYKKGYSFTLSNQCICKVDGNNMLLINSFDDKIGYGYINLDKMKGFTGLGEYPIFEDGIAVVYGGGATGKKGVFDIDGNQILPTKYKIFEPVSEGLIYTVDDKYQDVVFNLKGEEVFSSKDIGVRLEGVFRNGVAPVRIAGELKYGYIYNIYSMSLEENLARNGRMVNASVDPKLKTLIAERREFVGYYMALGNRALDAKDYERAISHYDKVLKLNGSNNEAEYGKSIALIGQSRYKEALKGLRYLPFDGTDYASAICYYNLGDEKNALKYCKRVMKDDPAYKDAQDLISSINAQKQARFERRMLIFGAVMSSIGTGLNAAAAIMNSGNSNSNITSLSPTVVGNSSNKSAGQRKCSLCNGTGFNPGKERPSFYSDSEDFLDNSPCDVCGSRSDHYHKTCPSCRGKGYLNY